MIAQVDRRKDMRLFIESGMRADLNFTKQGHGQRVLTQRFNKTCFDLSAGGFSFVISRPEAKLFKVNDEISNVEMILGDKKLKVNCNVINMFEIEPTSQNQLHYKGWKVSVKYKDLPKNYHRFINEYVFRYIDIDDAI